MTYGEQIRHPALALDPPERQRRAFWAFLLQASLLVAIFWFLPWLLARVGVAEREAGGSVSNPMGWR
jgi:hypothetical protein